MRTNGRRWKAAAGLALMGLTWLGGCGEGEPPAPAACPDDCFMAPPPVCEGNRVITFQLPGECRDGTCVFPPRITDCAAQGETCESGQCIAPPDPCAGVTCDTPPGPSCDGDVLVSYSAGSGACEDGGCSYAATRTDCAASARVCDGGRCIAPEDRCAGILCDAPPSPFCDDTTVVTPEARGTCDPESGDCAYGEADRLDCTLRGEFCFEGVCVRDNPCAGVTCTTPPAASCEGNVTVTWFPTGRCSAGECIYTPMRTPCDEGQRCDAGTCVEVTACDGVVCDRPAAPSCNGNLRNFFETPGTCSNGLCSYTLRTQDCTQTGQRCEAGVCRAPNPCDGVDCSAAPGLSCRGNIVVNQRAGTCVGGICQYPEETRACGQGQVCIAGDCETGNLCAGVLCNAPPAATCIDGDAVVFAAVGTCDNGSCVYAPSIEPCTDFDFDCLLGECLERDLCTGVSCEPLEAFCDGATAVSYRTAGVCREGICDYALSRVATNCTLTGQLCQEGACVGPGTQLSEGELFLSEVYFTSSPVNELSHWFELYNPFASNQQLGGLEIVSLVGGVERVWTVPNGVTIGPFGTQIFAAEGGTVLNAEGNPVTPQVRYPASALPLRSGAGNQLTLRSAEVLQVVPMDGRDGWPQPASLPIHWDLGDFSRDIGEGGAWCSGQTSPGRINPPCAARAGTLRLFISEIMVRGRDITVSGGAVTLSQERWFEFRNAGSEQIPLVGLTFEHRDAAGNDVSFTVANRSQVLNPGASTAVTLTTVNFTGPTDRWIALPGMRMAAAPVELIIRAGATEVDRVNLNDLDDWFSEVGRSVQVRVPVTEASQNDSAAAWCNTRDEARYGTLVQQFGSPGASNPPCQGDPLPED